MSTPSAAFLLDQHHFLVVATTAKTSRVSSIFGLTKTVELAALGHLEKTLL